MIQIQFQNNKSKGNLRKTTRREFSRKGRMADMAENKTINYKMLTLIIVLVIIITGVASFTFFTYFSVAENSEEKEDFKIEDIRSTYMVGDFVVNITDNSRINFIRASL